MTRVDDLTRLASPYSQEHTSSVAHDLTARTPGAAHSVWRLRPRNHPQTREHGAPTSLQTDKCLEPVTRSKPCADTRDANHTHTATRSPGPRPTEGNQLMLNEHVTLPDSDASGSPWATSQMPESELVADLEDLDITAVNWFAAGQRDWDLSMITATNSDDTAECEEARDELERLRSQIDSLDERALRGYLHGLLSQVETYVWHGLTSPRG